MNAYVFITLIVLVTLVGDYFLKVSSDHENSFSRVEFWVATVLYGATAAGWMVAMKTMSLANIGVYYSMLTIVLLTGLGVFVFKEAISTREVLGLTLALGAMALMNH